MPIFNKRKGKLDNVHARLHDVGKCENFRLGNFLTFVCIYFNVVYQIYMLIFHHWFLKVQGGHSFWNSLNFSGIFSVLEFFWKNGKNFGHFQKMFRDFQEVFWNFCHISTKFLQICVCFRNYYYKCWEKSDFSPYFLMLGLKFSMFFVENHVLLKFLSCFYVVLLFF